LHEAEVTETPGQHAGRFFESVLGSAAQPLCVVDQDGLVRYANRAASEVLGYDAPSELEGLPLRLEGCPTQQTRLTGEPVRVEEDWLVGRDGSRLPVSHSSSPIELRHGRGAVFTFNDIAERQGIEGHLSEIADARAAEARAAQRRIIEAGDAARRRVTQDLHDGAQQDLATVFINLQLAQQKWSSDPDEARQLVDKAADHAKLGVTELRELVAGIHPLILSSRGLGAAVAAFAGRLTLPIKLIDLPEQRLPPELESSLYFFVTEALTNVVKHARASLASVRFEVNGAFLALEVADDGIGGAELSSAGRGLGGLHDRVGALNGVLSLTSEPGQGTLVRAEIPVAPAIS
jgi:PAS domain S-box-containing protein